MRLLSNWTDPWLSHLPAGLLFASVVLRSALTYGGTPALLPILGVLAAWVVLFAVQGAIARQWAPSFHVYLALQSGLIFFLLTRPDLPIFDFFAILFCLLSIQALPRLRLSLAAAWLGTFAVLTMVPLVNEYGPAEGTGFTLIYTAANVILGFYAQATHRARHARAQDRELALQLEEANRRLGETSSHLEQLASARERHRLARELHDSVTQTVFSMKLATQSALLMLDREPDRVDTQLEHLTHLAQSALSQMQQLISELRPESIPAAGLAEALRQHVADRLLPDGLTVSIQVDGDSSLLSREENDLFAIAREGLNNIVKHARASHAVIRLHLTEPPAMEVIDDGRGFEAASDTPYAGVGLAGMRERASEIGWDLELDSAPGSGTRLRVVKRVKEERLP
ncbi:MAG: hypothetical protein A2Z37_16785 [Chloroflexi bacterium RBG_19FT_COMBO_62_14]|nr:MAG: hypothetical protein A2Z37_16785 [Chloroflexi bacterium RBG_19FT_COMBO_62_14]